METYLEGDIALILNVSKQRVRGWKRRGTIPPGAVVGDGLYKKKDIDALIENGTLVPDPAEKPSPASRPKSVKSPATPVPPQSFSEAPVSREEFMRNFWKQDDRAVDVLTMSPEAGALIVNFVNKALEYGYREFADAWTCPRPTPPANPKESPENFR